MIAGQERVSEAEIMLGKQTVNDLHPARRRTAMMFQNYALFPHLKCLDNVAFSCRHSDLLRSLPHTSETEPSPI